MPYQECGIGDGRRRIKKGAQVIIEDAVTVVVTETATGTLRAKSAIVNSDGSVVHLDESEYPPDGRESKERYQLRVCTRALKSALESRALQPIRKIVVYTDSPYVLENYKKAMFEWPKTKWRRKYMREPVENVDIWRQLLNLIKKADQERVRIAWAVDPHSLSN